MNKVLFYHYHYYYYYYYYYYYFFSHPLLQFRQLKIV